jgi:anti-anti-sigma regulatory factor
MIIDARDDVVTLSGRLEKNLWLSIQAAAHLLLRQHPNGILIDAREISYCSPEGARTFLDGLEYIERHKARIVLCQVPESVLAVLRTVPGVRSQVPIAQTCAEARASLELAHHARVQERQKRGNVAAGSPDTVLVPVIQGITTVKDVIGIAHVLGFEGANGKPEIRPRVQLTYVIVVPRSIALNAPIEEEEAEARAVLEEAEAFAAKYNIDLATEVARTRDAAEEIVELATKSKAAKMVLAIPPASTSDESEVRTIVSAVLHKSPCEVIIRKKD